MTTHTEGTASAAGASRRGQLAIALQEALTATVRLRGNRQVAADGESFRAQMKQLLAAAEQDARRAGYASDDVRFALFAVVAFIDESVLGSAQPMFAAWPRRPLQDELFGAHMAGELFFQYLRQLLTRQDSEDVADVLEVYQLCLLLGFQGRFAAGGAAELQTLSAQTQEKIARVRGQPAAFSPAWAPPDDIVRAPARDPWVRRLGVAAVAAAVLAGVLFAAYRVSLSAGAPQLVPPAAGVSAAAR